MPERKRLGGLSVDYQLMFLGDVDSTPGGASLQSGEGLVWDEDAEMFVHTELVTPIKTQSAEFELLQGLSYQPYTEGSAPFQTVLTSAANQGAGAGTYNHGVGIGFNPTLRFGGGVGSTDGKPGWFIGFENNYFDATGDQVFGAEWYIDYWSPDHTSQIFRPIYVRTASGNNSYNRSAIIFDIGTDGNGQCTVKAGGTTLFDVTSTQVAFSRTANYNVSPLSVNPASGQAVLQLNSANSQSVVQFMIASNPAWYEQTAGADVLVFYDKNARTHLTLTQGVSDAAALTTFGSSVKIGGNVGFYGTTPIAKQTGVAVTAEAIHAALVALGLIAA